MRRFRNVLQKIDIEALERALSIKILRIDLSLLLVVGAVIVYTCLFSYLTTIRHHSFETRAWDLGVFTQSLWTASQAQRFFYYTPELVVNPSGAFFGVHFSPILFLILPFYWLLPAPETLFVLQSFALALASIPIYKLASEFAGGRTSGLVFALAYLVFPAVHYVNWYDFHVQALLPLFFTYAVYYVTKENWPKFFVFMFLSLMCEEHVALIVFFVGVFIAWRYRKSIAETVKRKKALEKNTLVPAMVIFISLVWYWFTLWQRSTFFPTNPAALREFLGSANFTILGANDPMEIPLLILLRPMNAVRALAYDGHIKLLYLALLFGPLAFFSFKAPSGLIPTIPWFGFSLLSQTLAHHVLGHQYEAYVVSFIFASAIFGVRKNFVRHGTLKGIEGSLKKIAVLSFAIFLIASPICPWARALWPDHTVRHNGDHEKLLAEVVSRVPSSSPILTQDNIFPHVSHNVHAYVVPSIYLSTSIRDLTIDFVNQTLSQVDYVLLDITSDPYTCSVVFPLMEKNHGFKALVTADGVILFKKDHTGSAEMLAPYNFGYDYTTLSLYSGEITSSLGSSKPLVLHFNGSGGYSPMFWYSPRSLLPPGQYSVTLRLRINGTGELFTANICSNNGQSILASKTFSANSYAGAVNWSNHTFTLVLDKPLLDFEVRAVNLYGEADIYLDYIDVKQIEP